MKKLLAIVLFALSVPAFAQHHHRHNHHFRHHSWHPNYGWVIPTIIGGVVTYEIVKNQTPPPVVVQQQPVIIQQSHQVCTEWKEIQNSDGKIYRERTCTQ